MNLKSKWVFRNWGFRLCILICSLGVFLFLSAFIRVYPCPLMSFVFKSFANVGSVFICVHLCPDKLKFSAVAERWPRWPMVHDWKSCVLPKAEPRVRIPLSPPRTTWGAWLPWTPRSSGSHQNPNWTQMSADFQDKKFRIKAKYKGIYFPYCFWPFGYLSAWICENPRAN